MNYKKLGFSSDKIFYNNIQTPIFIIRVFLMNSLVRYRIYSDLIDLLFFYTAWFLIDIDIILVIIVTIYFYFIKTFFPGASRYFRTLSIISYINNF